MSASIKIAMVALSAHPMPQSGQQPSSQSTHIASIARALARCGHEVTIYARRDDASAPTQIPLADGASVHHISAGPPKPVAAAALTALIADFSAGLTDAFLLNPPDVVHAHHWVSGLAAMQATRDRSVPVVQTFHTLGTVRRHADRADDPSSTQRIRMEAVIGRAADRVIASCDDESQELRRMGISYQRISVVPPGIDLDCFHPSTTELERAAAPRLLAVGPLSEDQGLADQIRALANLPGSRLTVAGGPPADGLAGDADADQLVALAERLGVGHRLRLVGRLPREEVAQLMRSVDMVLCTPRSATFGSVAQEAMACGVPVVATAVGGLQDTVLPGITGELVPPRAPEQLAYVIRRLFADPVRLEAYRFAAADRARSVFDWDRAALTTEYLYRRVLGLPETPLAVAQSDAQAAS